MKSENREKVIPYLKIVAALCIVALVTSLFALLYGFYEKKVYRREYKEYVEKYSAEYGVPEYTVYAVMKTESNFSKDAVSKSGAIGLMQLMPETYLWLVERSGAEAGDIYDPEENIKYGVYLLSILYERYGEDETVFAAYNAGIGNVDKWLAEEEYEIKFDETKNYVNKVKTAQEKYKKLYCR